jgi:hypothetical protein
MPEIIDASFVRLAARGWTPGQWEGFVVDQLSHAPLAEDRSAIG